MSTPLDFLFNNMEVGFFREETFPESSGRYRYEPYRGAGHYEIQTRLNAGSYPRCYYETDGFRTFFTVRACPEYGVLELCDFESSPTIEL